VVLTVGPHELVLDVSNELPFEEPVSLAASVHVADAQSEPPRAVLICWPGGSYGRAYWDMRIPGHAGYSFAEHMTAQGFVVLAVDHLGVGASSQPADGDRVNFETMSAAAASFVTQVRSMLAEEAEDLGGRALASVTIIGIGHSLGACLTVVTQARHRCYDAVALLGFTHGDKEVAVGGRGRRRTRGHRERPGASRDGDRAASGVPARRGPEQELEVQLAGHGLEPGDLGYLLQTHLHHDHTGLATRLPAATILVQRRELQYAAAPLFPVAFFDRTDIAALVGPLWERVELLDGDHQLFDGVRTVHTGGHTPGHQMIYVETSQGRAIITGDAAYDANLNVGAQVPSGYWVDLADTMAALRRIADDSQGIVLPMHDRTVHERYPQGLG
jgi:glyoxylase-like metal-dependent hydrolase (beta-lactamase superfamily II)